MSNELTIPPVRTTPTTTDAPKAPPTRPARVEPPVAAAKPYVNPSLRLDAELGLVVIEFRGDDGALTATIPSERQIQAYRVHQEPSQKDASRNISRETPREIPREPEGESTDKSHRVAAEQPPPRPEPPRARPPERHETPPPERHETPPPERHETSRPASHDDVPRAEAREARPPPPPSERRPA